MKIGLIAVDSKRLNLALGKVSTYHKSLGHTVEWYMPFNNYDIVYMSKIFNFSPDYRYPVNAELVLKGGTGYSLNNRLPECIESMQPDYSLFPDVDERTSYGFLSRGCPNHCKWCVVPKCSWEGAIHPDHDIIDITLNGRRPYAVLQDNNILAIPDYAESQFKTIIDRKFHVDFNQAIDARLITPDAAKILAKMKWIGSIIRMGCDTQAQISECENAIELLQKYGYKGQFLLYCMIHGTIEDCYERVNHWRIGKYSKKIRIAAQPYRDPFAKAALTPPSMATRPYKMGNAKRVLRRVRLQRMESKKRL